MMSGVFDAGSGRGRRQLGRLGRHEACVGSAAAADADLVAGGAFEVVAEVVAELIAADVDC
jgi:hypothetical protein